MTIRTVSFLSILATGAGCAVGIPIGINTVPEKYEPLTWTQMVDKWEDSWKKIFNQANNTDEAKTMWEEKEAQRIKGVEKEKESWQNYKKQWEKWYGQRKETLERMRRWNMTTSGHFANLERNKQQHEAQLKEAMEELEKSLEKTKWEDRKEQIAKEFDERIENLKNFGMFCGENCSESLKQKINEAKDRVAQKLNWMREG